MIPAQAEIEVPLLEVLVALGGESRPKNLYPLVTAKFPQLSSEDLTDRMKNGESKWINRIQWARQALITAGEMASPQRGVWAITDQGRTRLKRETSDPSDPEKRLAFRGREPRRPLRQLR